MLAPTSSCWRDTLASNSAPLAIRRDSNVSNWQGAANQNFVEGVGGKRILGDRAVFRAYHEEVVPGSNGKMVFGRDIDDSWLIGRKMFEDAKSTIAADRHEFPAIWRVAEESRSRGI